ncbi:YopX family protein [Flavobacterium sp.]|uniref:YopX family protein n=1 Tax=Flavobacterium sp. TaxID=239 RepID=UPI0037500F14
MNTEIKFRAWNIPNKLMYQNVQDGILGENEKGQLIIGLSLGKLSKDAGSVLMQFSGLHGKNEIEIYEGDVLSEKWMVEVYKNIEGTYMVRFHNNPEINKKKSLYLYLKEREKAGTSDRDCVVIGNIHDNPELLITNKH